MPGIATYVFLDLGTTSKNDPQPKITEISMVALDRDDITTLENTLPLLQNKLTICINPEKELKPMFRLSNKNLKDETTFDKKVSDTMKLFLNCQRKPVCLIAHNGIDFDFPILADHFKSIGVWSEWNVKDIMCTDSLYAFYDIMEKQDIAQQGTTSGYQYSMKQQNETTPKKKKMHKGMSTLRLSQLKRKYYFKRNYEVGWKEKPESHELSKLSERVLGSVSREAHISENDCILIAEIFIKHANKCIEWVDENHCLYYEEHKYKPSKEEL